MHELGNVCMLIITETEKAEATHPDSLTSDGPGWGNQANFAFKERKTLKVDAFLSQSVTLHLLVLMLPS